VLGARNRGGFVPRDPDGVTHPDEVYGEAIANLDRLGIEALIAIGGEGTLAIAAEFARRGVTIIGMPKTIDNDLGATEMTFGFATALDIATEALDRLHTTAESHDRVMILEVMGRNTGWIALQSGIAGGADVILIPEIPFSLASIARKIEGRERNGSSFTIIVAAEGAAEDGSSPIYQAHGGHTHEPRLGGVAAFCARELEQLTGTETRCVVLGHLQRGGRPNAFDRMLASNFGTAAVRALADGESGVMVSLRASQIETVPLSAATANLKTVPVDGQLVQNALDTGISFGAP
jgi:6-phosphofructokinase 1